MILTRGGWAILLLSFPAASWLSAQPAVQLELSHPIERDLAPRQTDEYVLQVTAGQFARVVARQMGVDVAVTVLDPLGKTIVTADRENGEFGPEVVSFIAETAGEYRIRVASGSEAPGRYRMELLDLREPAAEDRSRIEAERTEFQAGHEHAAGTGEARLRAIELYERSAGLWRRLADAYEEGLCWYSIGSIEDSLGESQKAIDRYSQAIPLLREAGDSALQAEALSSIGLAYTARGERRKALEYLGQALPLCRTAGDRGCEAAALSNMGSVSSALGEKQKALEYFGQALPILRATGDRFGEATELCNIGLVYDYLGEKRKALEYYGQALPLRHALGDRGREAVTLNNLATVYSDLGEKREALEYFEQAVPLYRAAGDRSGEAHTLGAMGTIYGGLDEGTNALEHIGQALAIFRAIQDQGSEATALINIGTVHKALGDKRKALDEFTQALAIFRAIGNRSSEATALNDIGAVDNELGENQKALESFGQALELHRASGNLNGQASTLSNFGSVYDDLGEKRKAMEYYEQALALRRKAGDPDGEATTLSNMGRVYDDLGEMQKALEYFGQALALQRAARDRSGEATTLSNTGYVYGELGEKRKSLEYYTQVLPIFRAIGNRSKEAVTLTNIGYAYDDLGETDKALDYYGQALPLYRAVGDRDDEASTLMNIGTVCQSRGEHRKALDYYNQALPKFRAVGDRWSEGTVLGNIGSAYDLLGERQTALDYYSRALPLHRAVGNRRGEAITLRSIGSMFDKTQPDLAILFAKRAVNLLQTLRRDNRGLEESLRKSFEKSIESNYRYLAGLLVDRQRFGEAEEVLNLLKDKEAADFIRRDAVTDQLKAATLLDGERKALERYEGILTQVAGEGEKKSALVAKAAQAPLSAGEEREAERIDQDLAASNTVLLRYFDEEEKSFAANSAGARRVGELRESEGLQDALQALGPDVVAIYTLVLPDRYTALLVTSGARKAYSTPIAEAELNRKVFDFRQRLQNPASDPLPLAQELYRILFPEGLRQDLDGIGAKTIMWSIDGTLRYVPMAALHDGREYLVARFRNSLITPASLTRLTEKPLASPVGVGFGVSQAQSGFSALPGVPDELRRIFRQGGSGDAPVTGRVSLDGDFTRAAFLAAMRQPGKSVVHVATHFDSRPGVAANSNLLLGDGSQLSLAEIEAAPRLFSGVDLLTLSACSTAFTGGVEDGREVDSFGTIAQRLGARGVIASLWSVNDEATARLMEAMYRIRQSQPDLGKGEALRAAQERMASGALKPDAGGAGDRGVKPVGTYATARNWTHPYYWAPFILIGNWR